MKKASILFINIFVALAYVLGAKIGFYLAFLNSQVSPVWPPEGIAYAFLFIYGRKIIPGIFLGAFFANFLNNPHIPSALLIGLGNTLSSVINYWLLVQLSKSHHPLKNIKTVILFFTIATIPGSLLSAFVGVSSLLFFGFVPQEVYWNVLLTWFAGEMQGFLIVAPILIESYRYFRKAKFQIRKIICFLLILLGTGILSWYVFSSLAPISFLPIPILIYLTIKFGSLGTVSGIACISGFAIYKTIHDSGPFARTFALTGSLNNTLIYLDLYMFSITVMSYLLFALLREKESATRKKWNIQNRVKKELELKVQERTKIIQVQNQELQKQIQLAKKIQEGLLPETIPNLPKVDMDYMYIPMMDIGGDFVDMQESLDQKGVSVFICDVSGHGIAAALISTMVKISLESWYKNPNDIKSALEHVAKITSPKLGNQFISAAFMHVNIETKELSLLRAGHNPPLIIHLDNTYEELFPIGNIISNFSKPNCQELNYLLQSGDIIVLYTDGITEARNSKKEMFGTERLIQEIIQNRGLPSEKICQMVLESISRFSGIKMNFEDDITLIILKIQ